MITKEGYDKLVEELNDLAQNQRPKITKAISDARELGDLSENAEYHAAREKQRVIDSKMSQLQKVFANCDIIDVKNVVNRDSVRFGATVKYVNLETEKAFTVKIVSEYESSPEQGFISIKTPIAKALLGKKIGDLANLEIAGKEQELEVEDIKYI